MTSATSFRAAKVSSATRKHAVLAQWAFTRAPRLHLCFLALSGIVVLAVAVSISQGSYKTNLSFRGIGSRPIGTTQTEALTLLFVVCGNYYDLSVAAVKSAIAYSYSSMHLIIVADEANIDRWKYQVQQWPDDIRRRVRIDVREVQYPAKDVNSWRVITKLCSTQKLFLPSMLPEEDVVMYVDVDVIFLSPLEDVWRTFTAMNNRQIAAMALDTANPDYTTPLAEVTAPSVKPIALNTGVMLMNLTRMRNFDFERRVADLWQEHGVRTLLRDNEILDIMFTRYPELLHALDTRWNFRRGNCNRSVVGTEQPVAALHGDDETFIAGKEPAFTVVYTAMQQYKLGGSLVETFIRPLNMTLQSARNALCGREFSRQLPMWHLWASRMDCNAARMAPRNSSELENRPPAACLLLGLS